MGYWPEAMRAVKDADVILFILDARMPELSRNKDIERKLKESGKEFLIVFNKADLVSRERLRELMDENPGAFFVSVTEREGFAKLRLALQKIAKKMKVKLEVGVVGYPNVGKSAITNVLSRANKSKVSSRAGTTTGLQWASTNSFKILDSPGVIPFEDDEAKLGLLGAKNPEKLKDVEKVALEIISVFLKKNARRLEEHYGIKVDSEDEYEILLKIGEKKNLIRKGGVVDEPRTALMIVREWQSGKLRV